MEKEEGNENGSQVRAKVWVKETKTTLVWNNVPAQMTMPILPQKRLVDNSMISDIANQTNLYSAQKDPHKLTNATKSEIEQFIRTLFFMSIYGLPHTELYLSPLQLDIEVKKKKPIAEDNCSNSSCPRNKNRRNWTLANIYREKGAL
jgi:hypothetical protein